MPRGTPIITAFTGGETSPLTNGRVDHEGYYQSLDALRNMIATVQGPAIKRAGTRFINEVAASSDHTILVPFQYSAFDNYALEFGDMYIRFYTDGGIVMDGGSPLEVATPYPPEDLDLLKFYQSADVLYIVHPFWRVRRLIRNDALDWTFEVVDLKWGPFEDENTDTGITITPSGVTGNITLQASSDIFDPDHVNSFWRINGDQVFSWVLDTTGEASDGYLRDAGEVMVCTFTGTWAGVLYVQRSFDNGSTWLNYLRVTTNGGVEFTALEDGTQFRVKFTEYTSGSCTVQIVRRNRAGYCKITGFTDANTVSATVIATLPSTDASYKWSEGAFSDLRGYPAAIALYEQRMMFAGTSANPSGIWASAVDDYHWFKKGPNDDDSYSYTLAGAKVNNILWLLPQKVMFLGTIGDEWRFGMPDEPTTPSAVDAKRETEYGSYPIQALLIEGMPVFVEAGGRALRAIAYSLDDDSYRAPRFSEHAEHLLRVGIVDVAFCGQPEPIIWIVRTDGKLVSCTFSRGDKIAAFALHDVGGVVESICPVRTDDRDELWMIVNRTIDGATVRYVERMESYDWADIEDAFFVDCGLSYSGAPATTLGGLQHLEGEQVVALADGAVQGPFTVSAAGQITLTAAASVVHVGLAYQALLKTKRIEMKGAAGTTQGKPKLQYNVTIRMENTPACTAGGHEDSLLPIKFAGTPPAPYTGDKKIPIKNRGTDDGHIVIESSTPTPLTVVGLAPTMYASEL